MKKTLIALAAVSAMAPLALAEYQFDIALQDMIDNIDCFNQANCVPTMGHALVTDLATQIQYNLPVSGSGPDGQPLAYQFVIQGDEIFPGITGQVDYLEVLWEGPGFQYTYTASFAPITQFYFTGPATPPAFTNPLDPADGCYTPELGLHWDWEHFPDGEVTLTSDFTVANGDTLFIDGGITVYGLPGVSLLIDGRVAGDGTSDAMIEFTGEDWGGITFGSTARGTINYAMIHDVMDESDGGAIYMTSGADVRFVRSIIAHNETTGMGGAAYVESGAFLRLRSCTVSHNTANSGGNIYVADGGVVSGFYNLVTFGTPETMVAETGTLYSNLQTSCLYPLADPDQSTGWYCDPGYVDGDAGNFYPSFWNVEDPEMVNCIIDVAIIPEDLDPDGTPFDMGAVPFNQFEILHPAMITMVEDRANDQGGNVMLTFDASSNDGSWINPITFYSVWVMYPGADDFVSTGQTVGAIGAASYTVVVPTITDSMATSENPADYTHYFIVSAHNSTNPLLVALSEEGMGYSIDNIAPGMVTGFGSDDEWAEDDANDSFTLNVSWNPSTANDFDHYVLYASETGDIEDAIELTTTMDTQFDHVLNNRLDNLDVTFTYFVEAYDYAGNAGEMNTLTAPATPLTGVEEGLPLSFSLEQNYPNPFNPTTTLRYDLASAANVSLNVYNMQGQLVRQLVNTQQNAGRYELSFSANELASGVYIYHLKAGDFTQTRKMVLMK